MSPWRAETRLIADEAPLISAILVELVDVAGCDLLLTTGGTGPARRDVTPVATLAVASRAMPGFGEQMRQISLRFVPTAILSRQVAVIRETADHAALVINLPGQPKSIKETLEGLHDKAGKVVGAGHLRRSALLHRPDRRPLHRDASGSDGRVSPQERAAPAARGLSRAGESRRSSAHGRRGGRLGPRGRAEPLSRLRYRRWPPESGNARGST